MVDINNFDPNKYKTQAGEYSSVVSSVTGELAIALSELDKVNETLGFSSAESKDISDGNNQSSCPDILTLNTIVSNEEVKQEINDLQNDLETYDSLITKKAKDLDDEAQAEYDSLIAAQQENENVEKEEEN